MGLQGRQMKLECQFFLQISLTNPKKSKGYKNVGIKNICTLSRIIFEISKKFFLTVYKNFKFKMRKTEAFL